MYCSASSMCPTWHPRGIVTSRSLKFVTYTFSPFPSRVCTPPCTKSCLLFSHLCVCLGTTHTSLVGLAGGCAERSPRPLSMRTTVVCRAFSMVGSGLEIHVTVFPHTISFFCSW